MSSIGHQAVSRATGVLLPEPEAYELLARFGIPVPEWRYATTPDQAATMAQEIGFPVVLKVVSPDVIHKTDVEGVRLGLTSPRAVNEACREIEAAVTGHIPGARINGWLVVSQVDSGVELVAGKIDDPVFGPVLMFGSGGVLIELVRDVVFRAVPITERDASEMIEETQASRLLQGLRGKPSCDTGSVVRLLVDLSRLVESNPGLLEIDLNPIIAGPHGAVVVDARLIVSSPAHDSAECCIE